MNEADFKWLYSDDNGGVGTWVHFGFHGRYGGQRPTKGQRVRLKVIEGVPYVVYMRHAELTTRRIHRIEVPKSDKYYVMVHVDNMIA